MISVLQNLTILSPPKGFEFVFSLTLILIMCILSKLFNRIVRCDTMVDYVMNCISVIIFMIVLFFIIANIVSYLFHGLAHMF